MAALVGRASPNVIGQTIGEMIAGGIQRAGQERLRQQAQEIVATLGAAGGADGARTRPFSEAQERVYREALRQGRPEEFALDMAQVAAAREALEAYNFPNRRLEAETWSVFNSLLASADSYFVEGIRELTPRGYDRMSGAELGALSLTAQKA